MNYHQRRDALTRQLDKAMARNDEVEVARIDEELRKLDAEPDWSRKCENCDASPIVPATGLCGPCTTGDSSTAGGNW